MNLRLKTCLSGTRPRRGYTLVELMVALGVFMFVVIGSLSLHIFGLKLNEMVKVKVTASEGARRALGSLVTEIHGAGNVLVGNGGYTAFTPSAFNTPQQGNAIQIYPVKTDTNRFVRYFLDATDKSLKRLEGGSGAMTVIATSITNRAVFSSEDFAGNVLSNSFNNRVICVRLQFFRLDDPTIAIGAGHYYDFYQLQTRITRRALE
jgi:type II secretory pathway pseudopilin PulG